MKLKAIVKNAVLAIAGIFGGSMLAGTVAAAEVVVDSGRVKGPVKPVNGVGQPPMVGMPVEAKLFPYLKEAGIPYSRLHDVGGAYGQCRYVDISNLFPDFDADENDPKNYYFQLRGCVAVFNRMVLYRTVKFAIDLWSIAMLCTVMRKSTEYSILFWLNG